MWVTYISKEVADLLRKNFYFMEIHCWVKPVFTLNKMKFTAICINNKVLIRVLYNIHSN